MGVKPKMTGAGNRTCFLYDGTCSFLVSERVYAPSFQVKYLILL